MNEFGEYEELKESTKQEKYENWQIAIGLQATDNLEVSDFLKELANKNIAGEMSFAEVKAAIQAHYEQENEDKTDGERKREADLVSARISELLDIKAFSFSPAEYIYTHKFLFEGLLIKGRPFAGIIREKSISKKEWILNNDSIEYGYAPAILETLDYEFRLEKAFDYTDLTLQEKVEHIIEFMSSIWQIHAFNDGNTRATAVFVIRYLRHRGYKIDNEYFEKNSWYFRNALVRAHYSNDALNIAATTNYLNKFFENALFDGNHLLQNRDLHIGKKQTLKSPNDTVNDAVNDTVNDAVNDTVNDTVNQKILHVIKGDNRATATQIHKLVSVSIPTVKRRIKYLKDNGYLKRIGSDKTGYWQVIEK